MGASPKAEFQYTLQSSDTEALYRVAPEMRDGSPRSTGVRDVNSDLYITNPQMGVEIDREKAAVYGVTIDQVRQEMFNAFGTRQVATIYTPTNDYWVILESQAGIPDRHLGALEDLPQDRERRLGAARSGDEASCPRSGRCRSTTRATSPRSRSRSTWRRASRSAQAVDAIRKVEREARLPASITTGFQGTAAVFQELLKGQGILVLAAIFAAYVLLGILYESFIHPITIISGLPSAGVGALITLIAFKMDLSVIAMIGIVMLVGIVKKNAIMMIDFAIERRRVGMGAEAAMREACLLRFRPIMMTTFAADLRRAADRARGRRWRRAAPAARRRGGRRARGVAAADALHHAGRLHLPRQGRPHAQARARAAARGGGGAAASGAAGGGGRVGHSRAGFAAGVATFATPDKFAARINSLFQAGSICQTCPGRNTRNCSAGIPSAAIACASASGGASIASSVS